jgi:hypothetical protein
MYLYIYIYILQDTHLLVKSLKPSIKNPNNHMNNINNVFNHGGILAMNIYGSPSWHENVFNIIKNNSEFGEPIIIKIKNQKNVILITNRISI